MRSAQNTALEQNSFDFERSVGQSQEHNLRCQLKRDLLGPSGYQIAIQVTHCSEFDAKKKVSHGGGAGMIATFVLKLEYGDEMLSAVTC